MFSKTTKEVSIKVDKNQKPASDDIIKACGAVLLKMAGRDEDYAPEEVKMIFSLLMVKFDISDEQRVLNLLEDAKSGLEEESGFSDYIEVLNLNFNDDQKVEVLKLASKLMEADEEIDIEEERFLKQIGTRLQLPDGALD